MATAYASINTFPINILFSSTGYSFPEQIILLEDVKGDYSNSIITSIFTSWHYSIKNDFLVNEDHLVTLKYRQCKTNAQFFTICQCIENGVGALVIPMVQR